MPSGSYGVRKGAKIAMNTVMTRMSSGTQGTRAVTIRDQAVLRGWSVSARLALVTTNPRINVGIEDVDQNVERDDQRAVDQHDCLEQGVVAIDDGIVGQAPDAWPGKDCLDDDRPTHQQ